MSRVALTEIKKGQTGTGLLIENDGYISMDLKENKPIMEAIRLSEGNGMREIPNPFIVSAVFQKFDIENANGRVYPEDILKREVNKYQEAVIDRRGYGECNHPDSTTIDLSRIAMNVVELHWEGHTLVGKIELPVTEGFRKFGIISCQIDQVAHLLLSNLKIGVSSRGIGSVESKFGKMIVGDDYEIVCWDVVSQPSTPNAWIDMDEENLRPYVESVETKKPLVKEDKFSKFDKWLNG